MTTITESFNTLWTWHPGNRGNYEPCTTNGTINFENQCAIRMGVCLTNSGILLGTFTGAKCYPGHNHNQSHILRATELAEWIEKQPFHFGKAKKNATSSDYMNKKGIVYISNFYGTGNQGDHIDLWNGSNMARGDISYFSRAEDVWFWELSD